ncbi:aminoglycoside phosphotransferase family protein [Microbacterium sp. SLBN-146]|uniref:aminoglycoside phosphotransferase family protein n=1 Tax=Microbacterium sp. SLBN-146 TaxID=2768457 RepID=UPI0011532BBE|nr:aminoglycoside phosphotransferase family protein [Microbacterium sp. SLBN-146]TQJ31885.1 aminoglycoside phosphotransferase (APT) family kinase protein [Microbacterium sp. SLBN-146]
MADRPSAEWVIDELVVDRLVAEALPHLVALPRRRASAGWDCDVWRIGDDLALRMPRRSAAVSLVLHEQQVLPVVGPAIEASGVHVPTPLFLGEPSDAFPRPWSLVPWFDGSSGISVPREERRRWASDLANALLALHTPAPSQHPRNPFRGVPLAERSDVVRARLDHVVGVEPSLLARAALTWTRGVNAEPWGGTPLWIHGDLHPGNLVSDASGLRAIIDFGDVTAGDPACDLASAWLIFDEQGRADFIGALGDHYDPVDWTRARAWAVALSLAMISQSDDNPVYRELGLISLAEAATD